MRKSLFMVCAAMLLTASPISAQFMDGGKANDRPAQTNVPKVPSRDFNRFSVGYNAELLSGKMSSFLAADPSSYDEGATLNGLSVQYIHGFSISKSNPMFIEFGLSLNMGFWDSSYDGIVFTTTSGYGLSSDLKNNVINGNFRIPVNFTYRIPVGSNVTIAPYTGFNIKCNFLAKFTSKYELEDSSYDDQANQYAFGDSDGVDANLLSKDDTSNDLKWSAVQAGWQIGCNFNFNKLSIGVEYGVDFVKLYKKCNTSHVGVNLGVNF